MLEALLESRVRAHEVRFSADVPQSHTESFDSSLDMRERHYQDAIEISPALTPGLWRHLNIVCGRLQIPTALVFAFIYSSPVVQAECISTGKGQCLVRFSSAMLDLLTEEEFEFVIGHEIAHFLLDHRPLSSRQNSPQSFFQLRAQEISADRIGLLACASVETALRALMKTVSGLTERHLRFDVAAFISQLKKIEGATPDWSGSSHPSIVIRAKALLWLSLTDVLSERRGHDLVEQIRLLDQRVERDLQRFVDGAVRQQIDDVKGDLLLWMMTYEAIQSGGFPRSVQLKMAQIFEANIIEKMSIFIGGLAANEVDEVVHSKVVSARGQLERLIPNSFSAELAIISAKVRENFK